MENSQEEDNEELKTMGILDHLEDLRWFFLRSLISLAIFFPLGYIFSDDIISFIYGLSANNDSLKTHIFYEYFLVRIKFSFYFSLFFSFPYILWQLWRFVSPALYNKESQIGRYSLLSSYLLFNIGFLFGFFVLTPIAIGIFNQVPSNIELQNFLSRYISFVMAVSFGCGIAAQLPIIVVISFTLELITLEQLKKIRPYVIVGIFIISMFLTPPDPITQILLAIPLCIIFEISLLVCRFLLKKPNINTNKIKNTIKYSLISFSIIVILGLILINTKSLEEKPLDEKVSLPSLPFDTKEKMLTILKFYKQNPSKKHFFSNTVLKNWDKKFLPQQLKEVFLNESVSIKLEKKNSLTITFQRNNSLPFDFQGYWTLKVNDRLFILFNHTLNYTRNNLNPSDYRIISYIIDNYPYIKEYIKRNPSAKISVALKVNLLGNLGKDIHNTLFNLDNFHSNEVIY